MLQQAKQPGNYELEQLEWSKTVADVPRHLGAHHA